MQNNNDLEPNIMEETIFNKEDIEYEISLNQANINKARIWIYVVIGLQFLMACFDYVKTNEAFGQDIALYTAGFYAIVIIGMLSFVIWSYKNPYWAFIGALTFYSALLLLMAYLAPEDIIKGIILKVIFIGVLIKGIMDAKANRDLLKQHGL